MTIPRQQVVLSLFPGADLFGKAFEELGFCVVRGPELLLGQDIRDFHVPAGRFDGVIGGPPCQVHSTCTKNRIGTTATDLIGEFVRIINEAQPSWFVMENVEGAKHSEALPPDWIYFKVRDWDCGGNTWRRRLFWFGPQEFAMNVQLPDARSGNPELSLLASDGRHGKGFKSREHPHCSISKACRLQSFPEFLDNLTVDGKKPRRFMTKEFAIHLLGNGVPRAMGLWVADQVAKFGTRGRFTLLSERACRFESCPGHHFNDINKMVQIGGERSCDD